MIYVQLFITFFKIGLFGFGGGAAMLSLIQFELVENHQWINAEEFTNMIAVSQITPGPIGINCATYAGYLASGDVLGAGVATFALVLPSFIIMLILVKVMRMFSKNVYVENTMKVLRLTVVGLIAAAALLLVNEESFGEGCIDPIQWAIFVAAFVTTKWLKVHPIVMIVCAALLGLVIY